MEQMEVIRLAYMIKLTLLPSELYKRSLQIMWICTKFIQAQCYPGNFKPKVLKTIHYLQHNLVVLYYMQYYKSVELLLYSVLLQNCCIQNCCLSNVCITCQLLSITCTFSIPTSRNFLDRIHYLLYTCLGLVSNVGYLHAKGQYC